MASIRSNVITSGMRGKFGDMLVFKTVRGKTFATTPARLPVSRKESIAQRGTRTHFKEASQWAQNILLDPERKVYYRQRAKALKLPNAYTAALTDYMRKVKVTTNHHAGTVTFSVGKPGFTLKQVDVVDENNNQLPATAITVKQRKDKWLVHQAITEGIALPIVLVITDSCDRTTRIKSSAYTP